jgi:hypothetical protein
VENLIRSDGADENEDEGARERRVGPMDSFDRYEDEHYDEDQDR